MIQRLRRPHQPSGGLSPSGARSGCAAGTLTSWEPLSAGAVPSTASAGITARLDRGPVRLTTASTTRAARAAIRASNGRTHISHERSSTPPGGRPAAAELPFRAAPGVADALVLAAALGLGAGGLEATTLAAMLDVGVLLAVPVPKATAEGGGRLPVGLGLSEGLGLRQAPVATRAW